MKTINYESMFLISIFIFILLILEIIIGISLANTKIQTYEIIDTTVITDKKVLTYVPKETKEIIYKNTNLYLNDTKMKYKILEDQGIQLEKNNKKYYGIILEFPFDKKYKENDTLRISIRNKKITIIEMIKKVWKG